MDYQKSYRKSKSNGSAWTYAMPITQESRTTDTTTYSSFPSYLSQSKLLRICLGFCAPTYSLRIKHLFTAFSLWKALALREAIIASSLTKHRAHFKVSVHIHINIRIRIPIEIHLHIHIGSGSSSNIYQCPMTISRFRGVKTRRLSITSW